MNRNDEEVEIDLIDLCSTFFKKWKTILISMLICGLIGGGIALIKNNTYAPKEVTSEDLQKATAYLTDEEAKGVRSLYRQFRSYSQYKEALQEYSNSFFINSNSSGFMQKISKYSVKSKAHGASGILIDLSLSPEIYDEITAILAAGEENNNDLINAHRYVSIWYDEGNTISISNYGDQENHDIQAILTLTVIGNTKQQCDEISSLIEDSLKAQMNTVHKIDSTASLSFLGENYSDDMNGWLSNQQNDGVSKLANADKMLTDTNNKIKELSSKQKKYYDLLVQRDNEEIFIPVSVLKYLLIGILAGFAVAIGSITLRYMFDGTVKTGSELSWIINGNTPQTLTSSINTSTKDNQFRENETPVDLIVEDQTIKLSKLDKHTLYVVADNRCYRNKSFSETIEKLKKSFFGDVQVGNPLDSSEELQKLSKSDGAILVVRLKSTKQKDIQKINQYCQNYQIPINDIIVLSD